MTNFLRIVTVLELFWVLWLLIRILEALNR
jgi:hypothetical protein